LLRIRPTNHGLARGRRLSSPSRVNAPTSIAAFASLADKLDALACGAGKALVEATAGLRLNGPPEAVAGAGQPGSNRRQALLAVEVDGFATEYGRNFSVFMNDGQAARIDFMTTDAPNTTTNKSEKKRGYEEGGQKIELLRARWPKAFPAKSHEVRPLTNGAQQAMVEEFGWSPDYARAVLTVWKLRPAYCNAILRYPTRINLDGSASGEEIDDAARATATKRLEERAARQARKLAKLADAEQQRLRAAAKESAQAQAPKSGSTATPRSGSCTWRAA
jgi:sRNA-binding protein